MVASALEHVQEVLGVLHLSSHLVPPVDPVRLHRAHEVFAQRPARPMTRPVSWSSTTLLPPTMLSTPAVVPAQDPLLDLTDPRSAFPRPERMRTGTIRQLILPPFAAF